MNLKLIANGWSGSGGGIVMEANLLATRMAMSLGRSGGELKIMPAAAPYYPSRIMPARNARRA